VSSFFVLIKTNNVVFKAQRRIRATTRKIKNTRIIKKSSATTRERKKEVLLGRGALRVVFLRLLLFFFCFERARRGRSRGASRIDFNDQRRRKFFFPVCNHHASGEEENDDDVQSGGENRRAPRDAKEIRHGGVF